MRSAILGAATNVFLDQGHSGASMDRIAKYSPWVLLVNNSSEKLLAHCQLL